MKWILILTFVLPNAPPPQRIEGYASKEVCEAKGAEFKTKHPATRFVCVPGTAKGMM